MYFHVPGIYVIVAGYIDDDLNRRFLVPCDIAVIQTLDARTVIVFYIFDAGTVNRIGYKGKRSPSADSGGQMETQEETRLQSWDYGV